MILKFQFDLLKINFNVIRSLQKISTNISLNSERKLTKQPLIQSPKNSSQISSELYADESPAKLRFYSRPIDSSINFEYEVLSKRNRAFNSVLFQLDSSKAVKALIDECESTNSEIKDVYCYNCKLHTYVLIEFKSIDPLKNLLSKTEKFKHQSMRRIFYYIAPNQTVQNQKKYSIDQI